MQVKKSLHIANHVEERDLLCRNTSNINNLKCRWRHQISIFE